jgi:ELWxxDGT repeat protein
MKNSKRGPLSIYTIFTLKMVVSLLLSLAFNALKAQPLTLVKDINTPQIADLKNAVVYAVGNKIYISDGTANGSRVVYTGAANVTSIVQVLSPDFIYSYQTTLALAYYFVETTPTSAKVLRYNKQQVETLAEAPSITQIAYFNSGMRYVINGNQLWFVASEGAPKLIRTFSAPIKDFKNNFIFTTNSVWLVDLALGTSSLVKDGFTDIGESNTYLFAANDGGYNGTELWTAQKPATSYLVKDLNPGTASSNPRNFYSIYFTATSEGQNWIYQSLQLNPKRLISAPINTEIKAISEFYLAEPSSDARPYILAAEKTGSMTNMVIFRQDTPTTKQQIVSFTEGEVISNPAWRYMFTHRHTNGTNDIWAINTATRQANLLIPNATIDSIVNYAYVGTDNGKLWKIDQNTTPYTATLLKDFGANAKVRFQGAISSSAPTTFRSGSIWTSTINGTTSTYFLSFDATQSPTVTDVATITLPAGDYSSYPNSFNELNGKIFFTATDGEHGEQLWRSDGTAAGTSLFKNFGDGIYTRVGNTFKDAGFIYYEHKNLAGTYITYYKTNGTTIDSINPNTAEYQTIKNKFNGGTIYPSLTIGNVKYQSYYTSYAACYGRGCPTVYLGGIQAITADTNYIFSFNYVNVGGLPITSLQPLGNKFYFTFHEALTNTANFSGALWGSDGTAGGTRIIKKFTSRPSDIVVANGKLYFTAYDGVNGLALWTSDGTTAGTVIAAYFDPVSTQQNNFGINKIFQNGNSLYFIQNIVGGSSQAALFGYRIGGNSVTKITDLTDNYLANVSNALQVGANLYLAQTNASVGTELFKFPLMEASLGGPLSNQADLALTQVVTANRTADSLILTFDVSVKNKGGQTANNVKTTFAYGSNWYGNYIFPQDTVASAGFFGGRFETSPFWFIPSLAANQTATVRFKLAISNNLNVRNTILTTTKSDQFDADASNNTAEYISEQSVAPCSGSVAGKMLVDYYLNQVTEASPIVIQNSNAPSGQYLIDGANAYDLTDQYIRRARGYLKPTETGAFKFYISGDDNVDVYLSTDDNPANKQRIAYVKGYTSYLQFDKFANQTSASINLVAGRRYYLEIVNADIFGADFFNLHWATPSMSSHVSVTNLDVESFCAASVVTALPDLTLENLVIRDPSVSAGQMVNITVDVKNIGTASTTTPPPLLRAYLSLDQTINAGDYQVDLFFINLDNGRTMPILGQINTTGFAARTYYVIAKIDANNTENESNENNNILVSASTVTITNPNTSNYCASKGVAPWEYAISNVSLNTFNNTSDKFKDFNTLGYSDYTNLTTTLNKGQSYPLSITPLLSWIGNLPNVYCRVWIDFNQNKTFEANELVLEKTNQNPLTQSITIPTTATLGNTRMRVSLKFGNYPTACEAFDKGEVEDYTIQINEGTGGVITSNDIALSLTSTPSVFRQYTTQSFKISAKNVGNQVFTNVKIKFYRPDLTVSGGTKVASIGSFQEYCPNNVECWEWTIPTLAGGVTATLDIPVYVLNPVNTIGATATLLSSNPVDNIVSNNTTVVLINQATTPAVQPLIQSKPTQLIPIVIQRIAPTITENYIVVELESIVDKTIELEIINSLGTVVLTEKIKIEKGNNKRSFDVSQLPKGLYFIQTSVGKGRNVPTKFVKF